MWMRIVKSRSTKEERECDKNEIIFLSVFSRTHLFLFSFALKARVGDPSKEQEKKKETIRSYNEKPE
jgi:hypothetical protein